MYDGREPNGNAANSQSSVWQELDPATEPWPTMFQGSPHHLLPVGCLGDVSTAICVGEMLSHPAFYISLRTVAKRSSWANTGSFLSIEGSTRILGP